MWVRSIPGVAINPTPAASRILGQRAVRRATRVLRRRGRKRAYRGNPLPAVVGILGGVSKLPVLGGILSKIPGFGRVDPAKHKLRAEYIEKVAQVAAGQPPTYFRDHGLRPRTEFEAQQHLQRIAAGADWPGGWADLAQVAQHYLGTLQERKAQTAAPTGLAQVLGSPIGQVATRELVQSATRARRPARARYPTYVDRFGRQRYSTKPPGQQMRLPAGAQPAPGSPYSFFRGAVGKGGAATTAAQAGVALAAGAGAFLVTQRLLQHLGGASQRAEEAGVNAALAFRQARADFQQQHGRAPNRQELAQMSAAYKRQLLELGYDPKTFTRTRGRVAEFLETYNPLGG